jgi:hypothetical protein
VLESNKKIMPMISLSKIPVRIRSIEKIIQRKELKITFRRKKQKSFLMLKLVQLLRLKLLNR